MKLIRAFPLVALALVHCACAADAKAYDVIIVGSGPGGLAAAEYLSRDPTVSVLVLEAGLPSVAASGGMDGPAYATAKGWTKFDVPGEFDITIYNDANEKYRVNWIKGPYMWLGSLVGGCSSINAAQYFRPSDDYITSTHWPFSPARVMSLMSENELTVSVTDTPSPDGKLYNQEAYGIVAQALTAKLGYSEMASINADAARNAKSKSFGHPPYAVRNGLRDSPATNFLNKMKTRANVQLVTSAMVDYVEQSKGTATGVVYNGNVYVPLTARGAVVMAAGALSSPKVLIQSGVGPADQLAMLNKRTDFPGVHTSGRRDGWVTNANVGKSIFDTQVVFASFSHPKMKSFRYKDTPKATLDQYLTQNQTGPWASAGPVMTAFETYAVNGRTYDFQVTVLTAGFLEFYGRNDAFTTALYVNNPEGKDETAFNADGEWTAFERGSIYFGARNSASNDLVAMQNYTTKVVNALEAEGATFLTKRSNQTVAEWVATATGSVTHHFGGSCYASSDSADPKRCADDKLRVVGTSNIFVGDGSAMKEGTVNPYAIIMYIGREVGEQVKNFLASSAPASRAPVKPPVVCPDASAA